VEIVRDCFRVRNAPPFVLLRRRASSGIIAAAHSALPCAACHTLQNEPRMKLTAAPLTPKRWPDLETLFGSKGCSFARTCWCMEYRLTGSRPAPPPGTTRAEVNRGALKALVDAGNIAGLIGYQGKCPVGWISIAPREEYARLKRSPVMGAVDDQPVWSIICFVVPTPFRKQGVAQALLQRAIAYAKQHGAQQIEAYPVDKPTRSNDMFMWFGAKSMFDRAGFEEVARRKPHRPIVRLKIGSTHRRS
jgi:ribosomal protein S18 acetylase RimI-like enzyme